MAENVIVGAGLAGMVAAINLAREGRDVLVLEGERRVGGSAVYHPSPGGTPVDPRALAAYTGIDISEAVAPMQKGIAVVYGELIPIDAEAISAYMIERGPRSSSLDSYLYELAVREGVRFEFNHPLVSNDDFMELPPDSVIATGLYFEAFDAIRVPYRTSFHFTARQSIPDTASNHVTIYHGSFTGDYGYTCSINGVQFAHVFQRTPIGRDTLKAFEEQVFTSEGIEFKEWAHFTSPVPAATIKNPRLFAGDKLLAGSIGGYQEPYMFFGMLGALVSGKIAAIAVADRARALAEFKLATSAFRGAYLLSRVVGVTIHPLRRTGLSIGLKRLVHDSLGARVLKQSMPGWKNCQAKGVSLSQRKSGVRSQNLNL